MSKLKSIDPRPNFPKLEEEVLKFWDENKIFEKSLDKTKAGDPFVFFEGPPTANAAPALHHVEARAFKDLIPRYQTMRGRFVNRKAGWDTHGLPVELQVEKALGISGKKQIETIKPTVRDSIIEFNRLCRESVWQYKEEWEKLTKRMGYWVDMNDPYVTYHNSYIESVWWILKKIWDDGNIYLGHKVVPYCPRCGTALSSHEVALGYKNVTDTSVYVKFKLKRKGEGKTEGNTYILSWTTTPWTLPGNVALAVGADIDYVKVKVENEIWILAKERLNTIAGSEGMNDEAILSKKSDRHAPHSFGARDGLKVLEQIKGSELVGLEYEPLFDVKELQSEKSYKVYPADFVTTTDGTGVVHTAVMYGEEDYELGEKIGLPKVHTVDEAGHFIKSIPDVGGLYVKDKKTDEKIFEHLKKKGYFLKTEAHAHEYPHCWRCNTPLLYYARDSWFIKMSNFREKLLSNNEQINWVPDYIKHGRFGGWLTEVKDWAISRERYWGTPLPIWKCDPPAGGCGHHQIVGSIKELGLSANTLIFTRHGQAENNVLGLSDSWPEKKAYHLTEEGRGQVHITEVNKLKEMGGIDMIFASDLVRDNETAEIIAKAFGLPVVFDERLREINVGIYNGRPYEDYWKAVPEEKRWDTAPEGGESHRDVQERMVNFIDEINNKYSGKKILIVSHGDPLWVAMKYYGADNKYPEYAVPFEINIGLRDLHRPYIDDVSIKCEKCGKTSRRVPAVLDVWFDSGAMPYAQWHYPFENKEKIDGSHHLTDMIKSVWDHHAQHKQFPADYISEAIDQTRGWFYTLLAISTLLDMGPAYKNVINLGHLLDEKGQKMSKSKGNVVDPWKVMDAHGVDGLRWYMYSVNQPGDSKLFGVRDIELIVRKNFLTLWNVLSFLVTYANHDGWEPGEGRGERVEGTVLDSWIQAKTQELVLNVTKNLDEFDVFHAARAMESFINELSTWYVRRSRDNKGPVFYQTLYDVLKTLSKLLAPFTPFLAENIWQALKIDSDPESVHLADWPEVEELTPDQEKSLKDMQSVRDIVEKGHALRKNANIKLRQPLATLTYDLKEKLPDEYEQILADEVNVKSVAVGGKLEFDLNITPKLKAEGLARELERAVQEMRKKTGLKVGEEVSLEYDTDDDELTAALELFDKKKTYISDINRTSNLTGEKLDIGGKTITFKI
jgi:isoleucyl-tRNA synthetase